MIGGRVVANAAESIVLAWNAAMLQAVRAECTPPPLVARNLAILHLTLQAACVDTDEQQVNSVLAVAGCEVASALFPSQLGNFHELRDRQLTGVKTVDWERGRRIAARFLAEREGDGASRFVNYVPSSAPGAWRRTAPFFRPPELPQWAAVRCFAVSDPSEHVSAGPPALDSAAWNEAVDELRRLGGRESVARTEEQRLTAVFWSDFSYTCTPPGHWNEIAASVARGRGMDERQVARLFAQLNVAMADAAIVCWEAKYRFNFWRPITALAGEGWQPLLNTPAHPEYPSGHSAFSGAAAGVLAAFVGSDDCTFSISSDASPRNTRTFHSFSGAAEEISWSRVYAGIHYQFSCEDGLVLGRQVAADVLRKMSGGKSYKLAAK